MRPPGERSRVIAQVAEGELRRRRRMEGVERLRAPRQGLQADSSEDIRRLREGRGADSPVCVDAGRVVPESRLDGLDELGNAGGRTGPATLRTGFGPAACSERRMHAGPWWTHRSFLGGPSTWPAVSTSRPLPMRATWP